MPTLKGSEVNPLVLESPLTRRDIKLDRKKAAIDSVSRALEEWSEFKRTSMYSLVSALADPKISYFKAEVCKSVLDYEGWPVEVVREHQAECRGALKQWLLIRDQPKVLQRQLEELVKQEEEEQGVQKGPDEATKNRLKKFA